MKMLFTHRPGGAYGVISESWINAAKDMGIDARRWDGQRSSWSEFDPDVYIGCSGHRQEIPDSRRAKVAIHVNPYCAQNSTVDEPQQAINWTLSKKPDCVFGYTTNDFVHWWSHWTTKHNILFVPMATAGDITLYKPDYKIAGSTDVAYVGGYWPYKAKSIDKFLLPVCRSMPVDLYGWGDWPIPHKSISDEQIPAVLAAAKVGPCISEPHTHAIGIDVPERVFKVILSGAIPVHDPALGLRNSIFGLQSSHQPEEFLYLCKSIAAMDEGKRRSQSKELILNTVKAKHTYHHRIANLLSKLGFDYTKQADVKCDEYLSKNLK